MQKKSQAELKRALSSLVKSLKASGSISREELLSFFEEDMLPVDIFTSKLGILEAAVKYLHEQKAESFSSIAIKLNRNPRTIWASFTAAKRKHPSRFRIEGEAGVQAAGESALAQLLISQLQDPERTFKIRRKKTPPLNWA